MALSSKLICVKNRLLLVLLIAIVYISGNLLLDRWKTSLYYGDSNGYYLHVVSFFVNQDVGDYDKTITSLREVNPNSADPREDKFGIRLTEKNRRYIKYTLGVPVMETPFFLLAHAYAKQSDKYEANGWSLPYMFSIGFAIICYVLIGFYLLIGILERYFSTRITVLVTLAVAFATNIFFQSTYLTMAHGFLFFDYCLLMHLTIRFYETPTRWRAFGIGALVGLIALTRVPEAISALIPLLWGIYNKETLLQRIQLIKDNKLFLLLAPLGFLLVFSLQFSYWYYVSGQLVFNPYEGEGFNFLNPKILKGWFHYANGWLIYTPIMAFSLIGWFFLRRYCKVPQLAIFAFVGLHAYIHYSYYAWTYFPGLGSRPMVETYPLLAFGLGAFFLYCQDQKWLRWLPIVSIAFFTWLNLFQTWQMKEGVIWSERSNKAFYWETFATLTPTLNSLRAYDSGERQPKEKDIQFEREVSSQDFEDVNRFPLDSTIRQSGQYALLYTEEPPLSIDTASMAGMEPGNWLEIGISGYVRPEDRSWNRDACGILIVELYDDKGERYRRREIKVAAHIGNTTYSIWSAGEPGQWGKASFFVRIPRKANENWSVITKLWNPHGQKIFLDDHYINYHKAI